MTFKGDVLFSHLPVAECLVLESGELWILSLPELELGMNSPLTGTNHATIRKLLTNTSL